MRKILLSLFFLLLITTFEAISQGVDEVKTKATYYVSSSIGDDSNDGLSERSPKQHIYAIKEKKNVRIRLNRGDVFFEQIIGYDNCIFEAYGNGERPALCGFKVLRNKNAWEFDEQEKVWTINLAEETSFTGCLHGEVSDDVINNVGFIYDPNSDKVYGRRVKKMEEITERGSFCVSEKYKKEDIGEHTFSTLKWNLESDPRKIDNVCFSLFLTAIKRMHNTRIRNIAIVGFNFGIVDCSGTVVENCTIDLIGGSVAIGYPYWVRYGNGIEFSYNNCDNLVRGCVISRTFDSGATIQTSGAFSKSPKNIHFEYNKFYHCRQAFEYFLNSSNDYSPQFIDCSFSNNVCYQMGINEFSSPELRDANLLSYDNHGKFISIENNIFYGAPYFCGAVHPKGLRDNTVYLYEGQYLYNYHGKRTFPVVIANGKGKVDEFRNQSSDNSKIIILQKGSWNAWRIERKIRKKVGWKPVDLSLERL